MKQLFLANVLLLLALTAHAAKPNFVFILGEGQGWTSLSTQMDRTNPRSKSEYFYTPNLDRVAAEGMRFRLISSGLQQSRIIPNQAESGRIRPLIGRFLKNQCCKPMRFWFATLLAELPRNLAGLQHFWPLGYLQVISKERRLIGDGFGLAATFLRCEVGPQRRQGRN